jgi:anti-sigma B factor antagonist
MSLRVSVSEREPGVYVISPAGFIDTTTYPVFEKEVNSLLATSPRIVIFNMDAVSYISSIGVGIILRTRKNLKEHAGKIFMVNLQPKVKKIFEVIYTRPSEEIFSRMEDLDALLQKAR